MNGECEDVATSLDLLGHNAIYSIPIYEGFYLDILEGDSVANICFDENEFNILRELAVNCGAVAAVIDLMGFEKLALIGLVCIFTPHTGMNVFLKVGDIITLKADNNVIQALRKIQYIGNPLMAVTRQVTSDIVEDALNYLIERINNDLGKYGINAYSFDDLPEYYNYVVNSGDMGQMADYRKLIDAIIF